MRQPFNVSLPAQKAAEAALDDAEFLEDTLRVVHDGVDYLTGSLQALGLECLPTQSNFVFFRVPGSAREVFEALLDRGVIVRPLDSYGYPDAIRVTAGRPEENRRFVEALRAGARQGCRPGRLNPPAATGGRTMKSQTVITLELKAFSLQPSALLLLSMKKLLITIDGPAGAGKTTVSRALAARLGYRYVDTGALYRGMAHAAQTARLAPGDDDGLARMLAGLTLEFRTVSQGVRLVADGEDITDEIRTPEISMLASAISARPVVRAHLLGIQRRLGRGKGAVFEGRDMGTVVFPEAEVKFFLDASGADPGQRRRCAELKGDQPADLAAVQRDMQRRDEQDRTRELAPLRPAPDAITIDSTELTIDEVVARMFVARAAGGGRLPSPGYRIPENF